MICECLPGYHGNAAVHCDKSKFLLYADNGADISEYLSILY
jgi:hypothetical protein